MSYAYKRRKKLIRRGEWSFKREEATLTTQHTGTALMVIPQPKPKRSLIKRILYLIAVGILLIIVAIVGLGIGAIISTYVAAPPV